MQASDQLRICTVRLLHSERARKGTLDTLLSFLLCQFPITLTMHLFFHLSLSAHNNLIHTAMTWRMPQKQVGLPVAVPQRGIQDMQ